MKVSQTYLKANPSNDEARLILKQYAAAIEPNFVYWMSAAHICIRSPKAKEVVLDNLQCEIRDDHRQMLCEFVRHVGAEPVLENYHYVSKEVNNIHQIAKNQHGPSLVAIMQSLENRSLDFIPYVHNLAAQLGAQNFQYTNVHGEADIEHAKAFTQAYEEELQCWPENDSTSQVSDALFATKMLLRRIFTPGTYKL